MKKTLALDFGTTNYKAGFLNKEGFLEDIFSVAAASLSFEEFCCEATPDDFINKALYLLSESEGMYAGENIDIGIATQRSSFLLWEKKSGIAVTPIISWQDRRAEEWCRKHKEYQSEIWKQTGLRILPYYAGCKLSSIFESDSVLKNMFYNGDILFGTLDTFLVWKLTSGRVYQTDPTMASRTLMFDIFKKEWAGKSSPLFNFPKALLPQVLPVNGKSIKLNNHSILRCSVADQAASSVAVLADDSSAVLVNLGTGGFVMRIVAGISERYKKFLITPLLKNRYLLEGSINGLDKAVNMFSGTPRLSVDDPSPGVFCIPDSYGVGAPHWRATENLMLSENGKILDDSEKCRIVYEGIIFRVIEIIDYLFYEGRPDNIYLCGGNGGIDFIKEGLASALMHHVSVLTEKETTLLGAARLAVVDKNVCSVNTCVNRGDVTDGTKGYLPEKYKQWKKWVIQEVGNNQSF